MRICQQNTVFWPKVFWVWHGSSLAYGPKPSQSFSLLFINLVPDFTIFAADSVLFYFYFSSPVWFFVMPSKKLNVLMVCLNGKNYPAWAFQFQIFVEWKDLRGHIDGSAFAPDKDKHKDEHAKWVVKDAQKSWCGSSVRLFPKSSW